MNRFARRCSWPACALIVAAHLVSNARMAAAELPWNSPCGHRALLRVDPRRDARSNSPASVEIDFAALLASGGVSERVDPRTIEVVAYDSLGAPAVFDASRAGYERHLLPWRLDSLYGADAAVLAFVLPSERYTAIAVYFDTVESNPQRAPRYAGLVGDGDLFRHDFARREIGASHFDTFADLDRDGDLDLFLGGVEPFITCYENIGAGRLERRGRLASGGKLLTLPKNDGNNRSWVVPHFFDIDRDGDLDFLPSFQDGPRRKRIAIFENTSAPGAATSALSFEERGLLTSASGTPIGSGDQEGGWFPSITFVPDLDRDDGDEPRPDIVLGSNNRCFLFRNIGRDAIGRWRWADALALDAGGAPIELFNPCFELADVDADGDADLFAAPQAGGLLYFENLGRSDSGSPRFAAGVPLLSDAIHSVSSVHPRITASDFSGDGLIDLVIDRAWELEPDDLSDARDFGALFANSGTAARPRWERRDAQSGAPFTEDFQIVDARRQSVVRAADWNGDGRRDLLAGDCDGFVWYFENLSGHRAPLFAAGVKVRAGGATLSVAGRNGHARHDVCDWNGDGRQDLIVADGAGTVTVYLNESTNGGAPILGAGSSLTFVDDAGVERPIDRGTRAHLMVCDWNGDGRKDLVFSDQENPGYWWFENTGEDAAPRFAPAKKIPLNAYVRPNLGSFADWDGDGKKDFIGCEFEHSIRLYRNKGSGAPGEEPRFDDPDGVDIVRPYTIMMISGADVVDWNRDGDLDVITGQGHGASGLRFYERDYIEDRIRGTQPAVRVDGLEVAGLDLLGVVRRYADAMIEQGRDRYGARESGLFLSALDRRGMKLMESRPAAPSGVRRGDRDGLPWRRLAGSNPHHDENLLRLLYALSEITSDARYREAADHEIAWFFANAQSPVTGLLAWGEHMSWDALLDRPVSSGTELTHEFARPWVLWDRTFELAPEPAKRFALGLWNHQIADKKSGAFDRHALWDRHAPRDGRDFPRHGAFYVHTWAHAYAHTEDPVFLEAIEAVVARFERKRRGADGVDHATMGPLDVEAAARLVPEPLSSRLRGFAEVEDRLVLEDLRASHRAPDGSWRFEATWEAGYSSGVTAGWAMYALARHDQVERSELRDIVVAVADAYIDSLPDEDVDVWPMSLAHVISAQVAAHRFSGRALYLEAACRFARMAVEVFWQDSPLPRASLETDHYETITGGDSLALALLEAHAALRNLDVDIPSNTIDR